MAALTLDPDILATWIGREEVTTDKLDLRQARLMHSVWPAAHPPEQGMALPPLWHWAYFHDPAPLEALGRDGHPGRGGFLPPVALPRRMWAGGRFGFAQHLRIGDTATRRSRIEKVALKEGRSGPLCFVTVRHRIEVAGKERLVEDHDIVYRRDPAPDAVPSTPLPTPIGADLTRTVTPSPVMLFRFSAATFNSHRIHYDRDYARDVEGYPDLVFHGPLTALILATLAVETGGRALSSFAFRARAPLFSNAPFAIHAKRSQDLMRQDLWASTPDGHLAMEASADFA